MVDIAKRMANSINDIVAEQWILKNDCVSVVCGVKKKNSLEKLSWEKFEPEDYIG